MGGSYLCRRPKKTTSRRRKRQGQLKFYPWLGPLPTQISRSDQSSSTSSRSLPVTNKRSTLRRNRSSNPISLSSQTTSPSLKGTVRMNARTARFTRTLQNIWRLSRASQIRLTNWTWKASAGSTRSIRAQMTRATLSLRQMTNPAKLLLNWDHQKNSLLINKISIYTSSWRLDFKEARSGFEQYGLWHIKWVQILIYTHTSIH